MTPTLHGRRSYQRMLDRYGPPNAAPRPGEDVFHTDRVLFVDDHRGREIAYWEPGPSDLDRARDCIYQLQEAHHALWGCTHHELDAVRESIEGLLERLHLWTDGAEIAEELI